MIESWRVRDARSKHFVGFLALLVLSLFVVTTHGHAVASTERVPSVPRFVRAIDRGATVIVSFRKPISNGGSAIEGYVIETHSTEQRFICQTTKCRVSGLAIGSTYSFSVAARNRVGQGEFSRPSNWVVIRSTKGATTSSSSTLPTSSTSTSAPSTGAPPLSLGSTLVSGQQIDVGQALYSPSNNYSVAMQSDGNLVEYTSTGTAVWSTKTSGSGATYATMQTDGNLVVYSPGGAVWSSSTAPGTHDSATLQDDGNFVVYSSASVPLWSSDGGRTGYTPDELPAGWNLSAGQYLYSPSGTYFAVFQSDGNFVEYQTTTMVAQWNSKTDGSGASMVAMQTDGNLVVYTGTGVAVYASGTNPSSNDQLAVQDDGNLVIYSGTGVALWAKGQILSSSSGGTHVASTQDETPWRGEAGVTVLCAPTPGYSCTDGGYSSWLASPHGWPWSWYGGNWPSYNSYGPHNCTLYVAFRLQQDGKSAAWYDNANKWASDAAAHGTTVNQSPSVGSVAQWNRNHVAYVEQVTSTYIVVTADNYQASSASYMPGGWTDSYEISLNSPAMPDNFIHF